DDERGDRAEPTLDVCVEEISEPFQNLCVEDLRLRDEVGPVAERAGDVQAVVGENRQLLAHDRAVVAPPHERAAAPRPEVRADPGCRRGRGPRPVPRSSVAVAHLHLELNHLSGSVSTGKTHRAGPGAAPPGVRSRNAQAESSLSKNDRYRVSATRRSSVETSS